VLLPVAGRTAVALTIAAASSTLLARLLIGGTPRVLTVWRAVVAMAILLGVAIPMVLMPRGGLVHAVASIDRATGRVLWIREGVRARRSPIHRANSHATPTAVANERNVFAYFGTPGLMALSHAGSLLWTNSRVPFDTIYGVGASPVLVNDTLVVSSFTRAGPYLAAFEPATGHELWRTSRPNVHPEFGDSRTPLVLTIGGRPAIVSWGIDELAAHDLATGQVVWRYTHSANHRMGSMVTSMIANSRLIYLPLENGMIALDVSKLAAALDPVAWTSRGGASALATPVLYRDRIYAVSAAGVATCTDALTGEMVWRTRLGGEFHSSPIAAAGKVYFTDASGKTTVVDTGPQYRVLAENDIGEPVAATIAPVDGELYIRGHRHLYRVGP
jgi:outer membrane protein assembly factor BamB